nr:MAG TPA: hypothetical protein [Caudoviricetes sp.]
MRLFCIVQAQRHAERQDSRRSNHQNPEKGITAHNAPFLHRPAPGRKRGRCLKTWTTHVKSVYQKGQGHL